MKIERNAVVIGCGGGGVWAAMALTRLLHPGSTLTLVDGDDLEERNLDRQFFPEISIGLNKAVALANQIGEITHVSDIGLRVENDYLETATQYKAWADENTLFFGCVDNHAARRRILECADQYETEAFLAGNELYESEAMFYDSAWQNTPGDPRIYYPDIRTGMDGDPTHPSCTGEEQEIHPQLASANLSAVSMMINLLTFWYIEGPLRFSKVDQDNWPLHLSSAAGRPRSQTHANKKEAFKNDVPELP